ncbi:ATP-binding cassette domain-containing protein [Demequina sp. TTPB684]|uniref:ABC-F family ATP-binding cassette domain-containing protein n=1 Tax=unclassified Demequina TaxID=2620311 RepID=UPI001CF3682F|nr:ABC-F family ATP-binding cassette domain-containing protein [Demequina sp. TMPB413]MCB2413891.1 ATP-binding cassette domain-containing protein [Demequina sp. TTPB684]UPU89421.1 ATP-binding cassette domain-containing protein [Demequina sp. TMPB413]
MIVAQDLEMRIGARVLLHPASFRIGKGDRVGLVGRNGAGKTTLTRILAGEGQASGGKVTHKGSVGYLPQDPREGDVTVRALDRILAARDLETILGKLREAELGMASEDAAVAEKAMERYPAIEERFRAAGGYAAESDAARIAANLGLDERVLSQELGTLSGGQRRRVELARILFSDAETLLLDEPTNHLDADSIQWLRGFLAQYPGGLVVISHDVELVRSVVTKVFYLDANRGVMDQYAMGWDLYLKQREDDEHRRHRERKNAEQKASVLMAQANKMRASATKAVAAQNMAKRAQRLLAETETARQSDKVAALRFPKPAPCGKTPLRASELSKNYGTLEVFTDVELAIDRGSRVVVLGLNGAGKTTLLKLLAGVEKPDTGQIEPGHGLKLGYYAQEHDTLDMEATVLENMRHSAPDLNDTEVRSVLGSFLFQGDDVDKPARVLSGGEKTRLALATLVVSQANVLLLDEPTNNLDPASRAEILGALKTYEGAVVMVTHDEGAVDALEPERVLLLPDADEDLWNASYRDLISLA